MLALVTFFTLLVAANCRCDGSLKSSRLLKENVVDFLVALQIPGKESMHDLLLDISDPKSPNYGHYLTLDEIRENFGPSEEAVSSVHNYLRSSIQSSEVVLSTSGDMFKVTAPISSLESAFQTEIVSHDCESSPNGDENSQPVLKSSIRSSSPLEIPDHIRKHISFISLDIPTSYKARKGKTHAAELEKEEHRRALWNIPSADSNTHTKAINAMDSENAEQSASFQVFNASIVTGNKGAIVRFNIICPDGSWNEMNPPCANLHVKPPVMYAKVYQHADIKSNPYLIFTNPTTFHLEPENVYCFNVAKGVACSGIDGKNCTCVTKLGPLPKYTQLRANIFAESEDPVTHTRETVLLAKSSLFALSDVATLDFLSKLYNIPESLAVRHGSTQAIAEFYGEFYSNNDLMNFLQLSGKAMDTLPESFVVGDNPNNELNPGGEAQLDLEYIMGMAPAAKTTFYSFSDRNPFSYENEGFLAFLYVIGSEPNPPKVLSMSYGDIEESVFNTTRRGAMEYGLRCDIEFLKLGLRGVTILFSSGDDGVANTGMRKDRVAACTKAWPGWPASSPYVTAVGATQMSDKPNPVCEQMYAPFIPGSPELTQLVFKCTEIAETACSSTNGCIITTGGGFSEVYDRDQYAPWQSDAVEGYLNLPNYVFSFGRKPGPFGPNAAEMDGKDRRLAESAVESDARMQATDYSSVIESIRSKNSGSASSSASSSSSSKGSSATTSSTRVYRPSALRFNPSGRAYPDISAYGSNFFVFMNGR